jgi:hypothetical protein
MALSLGVRALLNEIQNLAKARGFEGARVDSKVNGRGELVLALLFPPRTPEEWGLRPPPPRTERRRGGSGNAEVEPPAGDRQSVRLTIRPPRRQKPVVGGDCFAGR